MDYSFKINNKTYKFRKWKVKDRIALSKAKTKSDVRSILVYNCLEDKSAVFDDLQYQYALSQIRNASLHSKIHYTLECDNCHKEFEYDAELNGILKPIQSTYKTIKFEDITIEIQDVKNREFYEKKIFNAENTDEALIVDFVLHIRSINNDESLDFKQTSDFITNLDIDAFESIFDQWNNMKFRIERIHEVKCPHCGNKQNYDFDSIPDFFPQSWGL